MHECSSLLIRCMDFRLDKIIDIWLEEKGIMNDCDIVSVAGASKALSEDIESDDAKVLLKQIKLSKKLHNISTVYLMHHSDCGAYGGSSAFNSLEEEVKKHFIDMQKAGEVIKQNITELEIKNVLVEFFKDGEIKIHENLDKLF